MRNKQLNSSLSGSISKGGVLYRAGEIPTLTKDQLQQAKLVNQLPQNFPFANWENMTTKQQLQQMRYSGLNDQEQWSLLNSNIPLAVLNDHNQAQNEIETKDYATRIAAALMDSAALAAAAKAQAAGEKPTVSTSLQNAAFNGQLGGSIDAFSTIYKTASSSNSAAELKNGTTSAKLGGSVTTPARTSDQMASSTPTRTLSQPSSSAINPNAAPSSQLGASTSSSFDTNQSTSGDSNTPQVSDYNKKESSSGVLLGIDTAYLSEESRKTIEELHNLAAKGITPEIFNTFLPELNRLREEEQKAKYFEEIKEGASPDVTWGTEMIYDQSRYEKIPGTFGPWGNIPEKVCGALSFHNLNQILGIKTRLDEMLFIFNRNALLTTNLFGALGVRPGAIEDFYKAAGLEVTRYDDPAKVSKEHDGYIVKFLYPNGLWIFPGGHYVAAEYDKKNDCFYVYNNFVHDGKEKWETLSPSSYKASADTNGYNGESFGWTIWGIDKPKQPQVKEPQHITKATTVSKGKWIRTSK